MKTSDLVNALHLLDAVEFASARLAFKPDPQQEMVLQTMSKRTILNCTRQWGKSTVTAIKAVQRAMLEPGALVLVMSPSARQSAEFLRKAATFVRKLGIKPRGDGDNETSLLLPNGSRIVGLPGQEATIRGFSNVTMLLIDEASRVPDELYRAMRPVMAVSDGDLWLLSTPFGKRGFFYEEWTNGGAEWTRLRVPATECPRIPAGFLAEEKRVHGERSFRQEYLCEFVSTEDALFDEGLIRSLIRDDVAPLVSRRELR